MCSLPATPCKQSVSCCLAVYETVSHFTQKSSETKQTVLETSLNILSFAERNVILEA